MGFRRLKNRLNSWSTCHAHWCALSSAMASVGGLGRSLRLPCHDESPLAQLVKCVVGGLSRIYPHREGCEVNALGQEDLVLEAFRQADRAGRNQIAYLLEWWPSLTAEQRAAVFRVVDAMKIANDSRGKSTPFRVISRTVQSKDSQRELV